MTSRFFSRDGLHWRTGQLVTLTVLLVVVLVGCADGSTPAEPPLEWRERPLDTSTSDTMRERLLVDDPAVRAEAIAEVEAQPELFDPQVFYVLSAILMNEDRPQEAMFWFYAGQLRARFDANRCTDELARTYLDRLNGGFGPRVNQYAFTHLDELETTVARVLEFDRATPHSYDPRWINMHTPAAMTAAMEGEQLDPTTMSKPEAEWPAIAEQTRQDYEAGFREAMAQVRQQ